MKNAKALKWAQILLPLFFAVVLWLLVYVNSFFSEPSAFTWYALVWILVTFYLQWKCFALLNKRLDIKVGWHKPYKRFINQAGLVIVTGTLLFDCTYIILNWVDNNWMGNNNPLSLTHVLGISVYGFIFTCFVGIIQFGVLLNRNWKNFILAKEQTKEITQQASTESHNDERIQRLIVKKGIKTHVLLLAEVAYFEKDELVFAITHTNDRFVIDHSLKELMKLIDRQMFFRISRQHILNIKAIKEWTVLKNNLEVGLNDLPHKLKVSQRNIPQFKAWASELEV